MRKFIFFTIFLLLFAVSASAVDFNPKGYSTEELKEIYMLVDQELKARDESPSSFIPWFNEGLGIYLPLFTLESGREIKYGSILHNTNRDFYVSVQKATKNDYINYVSALKMAGYTIDPEFTMVSYDAKNAEGYIVSVSNYSPSAVTVSLTPPAKTK